MKTALVCVVIRTRVGDVKNAAMAMEKNNGREEINGRMQSAISVITNIFDEGDN